MFERVLFPTDFSAYANSVFQCLPELKAAGTRDVLLLGVVSPQQVPLGHSLDQDVLERIKWGSQQLCARLFQRILHPTDFSETANAAFNIVRRLKSAGAEEVILLHVQDERAMEHRSVEQLAKFDEEDMARLETMRKALILRGLPGRVLIRHGLPSVETLKVAEEEEVSLIVMGSRGRSAVAELLTGSTFENVVRQSRRPALVIRGEDS